MKQNKLIHLGLIAAAAAFTACSDNSGPVQIVTDQQLNADVAAASGDAIASDVSELITNESFAGMPAPPVSDVVGFPPGVNVVRTRTCFDAQNVAQAACNATTTASVLLTMTVDGSFSRSNTGPHGSETMSIGLHRARTLTISGLLGTETSRTHDGVGTSADTTSFSGTNDQTTRARTMTEASLDSVVAIVFNLPHATNPWPVSGKVVRNVSGSVVVTGGPNPGTRTFTRRVEVTFPADAQGNVTITINTKTCTLNLVTHAVVNCST
jgi:hypothetical protein